MTYIFYFIIYALEEAEISEPAFKEGFMTGLNLTEGLGLDEAGISVFENIDWNEQRTATTGQGTVRLLACLLAMESVWRRRRIVRINKKTKKKKSPLSCPASAPHFKLSSGNLVSPSWLLDASCDDPGDSSIVNGEVSHSWIFICLSFHILYKFFITANVFLLAIHADYQKNWRSIEIITKIGDPYRLSQKLAIHTHYQRNWRSIQIITKIGDPYTLSEKLAIHTDYHKNWRSIHIITKIGDPYRLSQKLAIHTDYLRNWRSIQIIRQHTPYQKTHFLF